MTQRLPTAELARTVIRLLIVDDSPEDRAEIRRLVLRGSEQQYHVVEAVTGAAAVQAVLDGDPPSCVVLDYHLPDIDAPDVIAALLGPHGLTVCPVVVLTGSAGGRAGRAVLHAGAHDYIGKDQLTPEGLVRAIANAIERWHMAAERMRNERRLRESEQRLRLAQRGAQAGIWEVDLSTGQFAADDEALRLHGLAPGTAMTHETALAVIHPDDRPLVEAALHRARENNEPYRLELRTVHPDGSVHWLLAQADRQDQLTPSRLIGLVQDITARKQAEEITARNAALFSKLIEQAPSGVLVVDAQFRLVQVNAQALPIFTSVQPLLGRDFEDVMRVLWGPEVGLQLATVFRHTLESGQRHVSPRFSERRHDIGVEQSYEWEIQRLVLPDGQHGVVCYFQDTTERTRHERNLSFLTDMQKALASLASAEDIMRLVGTRLEGLLRLTNCLFMEVDEAAESSQVMYAHCANGAQWRVGTWRIAEFHTEQEQQRLAAGRVVVVTDLCEDAELPHRTARFKALGIRAFVNAAYVDQEAWRFVLHVSCAEPTVWLPQDVELIRELAAHTWLHIERARAEAALRESEVRLRLAVEAADTGLWTWDLESDAVTWSGECYTIHGMAEGAFAGTGAAFFQLVHPSDQARVQATVQQAIDSRTRYECEFRIVRPDGTLVWVTNRGRCSYDGAGRALRVLGTITDVSDRKRAEEARRTSDENLRMALSAAKAGAWGWDIETGAITWSPENYALYGLDVACQAPAYGDWEKNIHPDDLEPSNAAVKDALARRTPEFRAEFRVLHPTDGIRWLLGLGKVEFDPAGNPVRMFGINLDITERKRFEATLADQDKRKDEFMATLAHELRSPLSAICNGLGLLKLAQLDQRLDKVRAMLDRQVGHLVFLVNDLLDVARVKQGKITLKREHVAVRSAVEAAIEGCASVLNAKKHTLSIDMADASISIYADRNRVVQALSNLLTNAAKYSHPGSQVTVSCRQDGTNAVISVADNGMGIAPDALPFVWNMFTQVSDTLDQAQGGLGIGLSLVKRLVELHGGTVFATSDGIGCGSTFTLQLPLGADVASDVDEPDPHRRSQDLRTPAQSPRILVIDDSVDVADSIGEILKLEGNAVRMASDGEAGIGVAREWLPDVVLCDIGLPTIDGHEVARRIRREAWGEHVVLIALTGWGGDAARQRTRDAGFDDHLVKPVDIDVLLNLLSPYILRAP